MNVPAPHGMGEARPKFDDLLGMFRYAVTEAGADTALVHLGREITYAEEGRAVAALAARLKSVGVAGRPVALLIPNSMEYHVGFFAILTAGGIPALLNATFPADALRPLLKSADPAAAICVGSSREVATRLGAEIGVPVLCLGEAGLTIDALVAEGGIDDGVPPDPNAPAVLMFSGGTTGVSKSVPHSHAALAAAVYRMEWGWPTRARGEVWLPVAPFFHVYGFLNGVANPVFGCATVVIPERFQPDLVVSMLAEHKVSVFGGGPPAIYAGLLAATNIGAADLSHLRVCPGGGAPFPVELMRRWKALTGLDIHEGYGMTEIAPIAVNTETFGARAGSVGKAVPDVIVEAVDIEAGTRVLPAGAPGELRIKGPHLFTGYGNRPEEDAQALRDGYLYTGDIGYVDAEGFIFITDRKKDVIFVKGFNVFPREIEEVLFAHESVTAAGVVGAPDERAGERAVAFVTTAANGNIDAEGLRAHCELKLAPYKVPAEIRIVSALPLTPAGKLDRLKLREVATSAARA